MKAPCTHGASHAYKKSSAVHALRSDQQYKLRILSCHMVIMSELGNFIILDHIRGPTNFEDYEIQFRSGLKEKIGIS